MTGVRLRDYEHYLKLMLAKEGPLSSAETTQVQQVLDHMRQDPTLAPRMYEYECEFDIRAHDLVRLEQCVSEARTSAPDSVTTLLYAWDLAVARGNFTEARQLLDRMGKMGMKPDAMDWMETELRAKSTSNVGIVVYGILLFACLIAIVSAGVLLARQRAKKHPPVVEDAVPVNIGP